MRNTTEGLKLNTPKDFKSVLEISNKVRPKWDGHPLNWKDFFTKWEYYWTIRSNGVDYNPEIKKMLFIE